jgi:hypothetical protein
VSVARAKFAAATQLYEQRERYQLRRWEIEQPQFPVLRVWFLGRDGTRRVGVRMQLRNYDFLPPSMTFIDHEGRLHSDQSLGLLLRPPEQTHIPPAIFREGILVVDRAGAFGGYLPGGHPFTERPFLCVRGTWEFHVHPQHADLPWDWIRPDPNYGLDYLLTHARANFRDDVFA